MRASPIAGINAAILVERFAAWLASDDELTATQTECMDLLADFHFDLSGRSKFLLMYAVIEKLCSNPIYKGDDYCKAIRNLLCALDHAESTKEIKLRIRKDLIDLQALRGTARCKKQIELTLGKERAHLFAEITRVRAKIAHHGHKDDLHQAHELYRLARDLLFACLPRRR